MRTTLWLSVFLSASLAWTATPASADSPGPGAGLNPDEEVTAKADKKLKGFEFDYSLFDGSGLNAQNYSNLLTMYFEPTWQFGRLYFKGTRFSRMAIAGRWSLSRALKSYDDANYASDSALPAPGGCSNITPSSNGTVNPGSVSYCPTDPSYRWDYGDIWLTIKNPKLATIPVVDINFNPSFRVVIPTSLEARYQTEILAATAFGGLSHDFMDGKLRAAYSLGFTKYFFQYKQPGQSTAGDTLNGGLSSNQNYNATDATLNTASIQNDPSRVGPIGKYNPDFGFMHLFSLDYKATSKLSFSGLYILLDTYAYASDCPTTMINGQPIDPCANATKVQGGTGVSNTGRGISDTQVLWLTAAYQVNDWFGVSLSWINWAPLRKPDNSWRQPFISTNYDAFTTVNFGATVSLEKLGLKAL